LFVSIFFIPKTDRFAWRVVSIVEFELFKILSIVVSKPNNGNDLNNFIIASHRGVFSKKICDNTEKSILLALKNGYSFIELDVSFSKDNIPIIYHDDSFKHKANLDKKTNEVYWKEIQNLRLIDGQRISSLEDVLKNYAKNFKGIILDVKTNDTNIVKKVRAFSKIINSHKNLASIYIIGLPFKLITEIKNQNPKLKVGCENLGVIYNYITGKDLISLNYYSQFSALEYYFAKKMGLDIIIWTVNEYEIISRLKQYSPIIVLTDISNMNAFM
jgi:glycerophosphoryl diester phosphodiesterase